MSSRLEAGGRRPRLLYCVTVPMSAATLLRGQLAYFAALGYDVHVASSPGPELAEVSRREGATVHEVAMERQISPVRDLRSLLAMISLMRRLQPDIVNAGTPKAGLLGMVAARLAGVRCRVYVLRGLRLETATGLSRWLMRFTERVACSSAHVVVCVSPSLRDEAVGAGLAPGGKTLVVGAGSSNGVDFERFARFDAAPAEIAGLRDSLGLPEQAPTVGFIGRLTRDKGIVELVTAFERLYTKDPARRLLLVGGIEQGDPVPETTRATIEKHPGVILTGFVDDTAPYYRLMDVLCLPSYREGFPNTPLEAAASGVPTVTTDATGARDSVVDGVTGLVVRQRDAEALADALGRLLEDADLARGMGRQARERARSDFAPATIWRGLDETYRSLLAQANP